MPLGVRFNRVFYSGGRSKKLPKLKLALS